MPTSNYKKQPLMTSQNTRSTNGCTAFLFRLLGRKSKRVTKSANLKTTKTVQSSDGVASITEQDSSAFERSDTISKKSSRWKSRWKRKSFRNGKKRIEALVTVEKAELNEESCDERSEVSKTSRNSFEEFLQNNAGREITARLNRSWLKSGNNYEKQDATIAPNNRRFAYAELGSRNSAFLRSHPLYSSFQQPNRMNFKVSNTDFNQNPTRASNSQLDKLHRCLSAGDFLGKHDETMNLINQNKIINNSTIKCASSVIDLSRGESNTRDKFLDQMNSTTKRYGYKPASMIPNNNATASNYVYLGAINEQANHSNKIQHNTAMQSLSKSTPTVNYDDIPYNILSSTQIKPNPLLSQHRLKNLNQHSEKSLNFNNETCTDHGDSIKNRSRSRTKNIQRRYTQNSFIQLPSNTYQYSLDNNDFGYQRSMTMLAPPSYHSSLFNNDNSVYMPTGRPNVNSLHNQPRPKSCYDRFDVPSIDDLTTYYQSSARRSSRDSRNITHTSKSGDYYHLNVILSKPKSTKSSSTTRKKTKYSKKKQNRSSDVGAEQTQIYYSLDV